MVAAREEIVDEGPVSSSMQLAAHMAKRLEGSAFSVFGDEFEELGG